jgi:type I restriction enzyme S subunit
MEVKPGYKQTEVGLTPEDWEVVQLEVLVSFVTSGSRGWARFYSENGALFIRSQNVRDGRLVFDDIQYVTPPCGAEGDRTKVKINDVLITITGNSVGNVAVVEHQFDEAYISQHVGLVRLKIPETGPYICRYLSPNSPGNPQIAGSQSGQSKPGLNLQNLRSFWIAAPPTTGEVEAIAEALSDVDGLLGGLDRLIAKKRDLKQAAMQQLLTGQIRLPGFTSDWKALNMAEKSTLKARIGWQGLTTAEYLPSGRYFLVTGTDFANGSVNWDSCCFVSKHRYAQDRYIQLRPEDVLLTKDGTIGKVGFIDAPRGPATLNSGVFVIRPKDNGYDPKFFYYVLTSRIFQDFLSKLQAGSTISHLYQKDFISFSFLAPPTLAEQTAIAEVLTDMDAELAALEQRREKTRALKQAMMQELLTGRTRLV